MLLFATLFWKNFLKIGIADLETVIIIEFLFWGCELLQIITLSTFSSFKNALLHEILIQSAENECNKKPRVFLLHCLITFSALYSFIKLFGFEKKWGCCPRMPSKLEDKPIRGKSNPDNISVQLTTTFSRGNRMTLNFLNIFNDMI